MTTYYEQGLQSLQNMHSFMKQVEHRFVEVPKREASTTIYGVSLSEVLGRYTEPGPIPLQVEHLLQYIEKEGT